MPGSDVLEREKFDLLPADYLGVHAHLAVGSRYALRNRQTIKLFQHLHLCVIDRIGEVVTIDAPDVCFPAVVVESLYLILPRFVQVNCFFMECSKCGGKTNLGY